MKRLGILLSALLLCAVGARTSGVVARWTPQIGLGQEPVALPDYDIRADHRRALVSPEQVQTTGQRFRLFDKNPRARIRWSSLTGAPSRILDLQDALTPS